MQLLNKKILFISPRFFDYEKEIILKLEEMGATVFFIDDRPKNDIFTKFVIRFNLHNIYEYNVVTHYKKSLGKLSNINIDYVFVNTPEGLTESILLLIKKFYPKSIYILYMWDSFRNRPNAKKILKYFDKKFTFDSLDAKENQMKFRALFYIDSYITKQYETQNDYKLCFIGTAHTDRYLIVRNLFKNTRLNISNNFTFFYLQSKVMYLYKKVFEKAFREVPLDAVSFKPLSKKEARNTILKSECVIDIHHPLQVGLTMRSLEALGARKKIITTNKDIINYDFYSSNNIQIIDRTNPSINLDFFEMPFKDYESELYFKYSIQGWLNELFFN